MLLEFETVVRGAPRVALVLALGGLGLGCLGYGRRYLRGTTLLAPWMWACGSLLVLVAVEAAAAAALGEPPAWLAHLRYLAAVTTLAPSMAVLGAKRPQDRAWQWIVLSLLVILALPSLRALALGALRVPAPHAAWRWFLAILMAAGLLNYLPTRFWLAGLLAFAGQLLLLADYLPRLPLVASHPLLGLASLAAATAAAAYWAWRRRRTVVEPLDRLWLDFRDLFGLLWSLRVAERLNASASLYGWNIHLGWTGFQMAEGHQANAVVSPATPPEVPEAVLKALQALLWRFVDADWIAARLNDA